MKISNSELNLKQTFQKILEDEYATKAVQQVMEGKEVLTPPAENGGLELMMWQLDQQNQFNWFLPDEPGFSVQCLIPFTKLSEIEQIRIIFEANAFHRQFFAFKGYNKIPLVWNVAEEPRLRELAD